MLLIVFAALFYLPVYIGTLSCLYFFVILLILLVGLLQFLLLSFLALFLFYLMYKSGIFVHTSDVCMSSTYKFSPSFNSREILITSDFFLLFMHFRLESRI